MRDSEMVAAIMDGSPAGLAAAYDRYAAAVHAYCYALLADPGEAADAVRATFIIALAKLAHLRDAGRLGPWLYAIARNECRRRLRDRAAVPGLGGDGEETSELASVGHTTRERGGPLAGERTQQDYAAGDLIDAGDTSRAQADMGAGAETLEAHELVAAAMASLVPPERDVAELLLRHNLDDDDLAAALALSRGQAHALASRARKNFEASLGALLVASEGLGSCPALATLLAGWDGILTAPLRKRLSKHFKHCLLCGERKRHALEAAMLFGLQPATPLPDGVWQQVIGLASDDTPGGAASRAHIAQAAPRFGKSGFPVPLDPPVATRASRRSVFAAALGLLALAVAGAGTVIVTDMPNPGVPPSHHGSVLGVQAATPTPRQQAAPGGSHGPAAHRRIKRGTHAVVAPVQATTTPEPTSSPSASAAPPATGTLTASPATVTLKRPRKGSPTGSFLLTASGGPVQEFAIMVPAEFEGDLTVTPSTGSLADGETILITVFLRKGFDGPLDTQLTLQPGGLAVTVIYRMQGQLTGTRRP